MLYKKGFDEQLYLLKTQFFYWNLFKNLIFKFTTSSFSTVAPTNTNAFRSEDNELPARLPLPQSSAALRPKGFISCSTSLLCKLFGPSHSTHTLANAHVIRHGLGLLLNRKFKQWLLIHSRSQPRGPKWWSLSTMARHVIIRCCDVSGGPHFRLVIIFKYLGINPLLQASVKL